MNIEVPSPSESGADGSQVLGDSDISGEFVEASQLSQFPMVRAKEGLAASNTRAFGSEATSTLIVGATSHIANELSRSQKEITQLRNQIDDLRDKNSEYVASNAVLKERINSYRANRHLRNLGIVVGTTLLGVGFQLVQMNLHQYGYISFGAGTLLLLISWLSTPTGGEK